MNGQGLSAKGHIWPVSVYTKHPAKLPVVKRILTWRNPRTHQYIPIEQSVNCKPVGFTIICF